MSDEVSAKQKSWAMFDLIVEQATQLDFSRSPWQLGAKGDAIFEPDFATLERLLGVPLYLGAEPRTGIPALAMDVWISYELRRAGFDANAVWPRPTHPRILPGAVVSLLEALPKKERAALELRLARAAAIPGVTSASASILGKNYAKQVDVIMTDPTTGPELLISTKRMDSSYGKNAANRIEESYGDVKNLRLRHPLAALGFMLGLRSDILLKEPETADWLMDLLLKLGEEDDAYHATCLVMFEYADALLPSRGEDSAGPAEDLSIANGLRPSPEPVEELIPLAPGGYVADLLHLPAVKLQHDSVPSQLQPSMFFTRIFDRVLGVTPVTYHRAAREMRSSARVARHDD